jgi:predicted ATPase
LTLVGPPGIGKTRLAIELAREPEFASEKSTAFVSLSHIGDIEGIRIALARGLGLEVHAPDLSLVLGESKPLLVVLDDVTSAVAPLSSALPEWIAIARRHRWVCTASRPLGLPGEALILVGALSGPTSEATSLTCEAGRLFLERARQVAPWFELSTDDAPFLAQLLYTLDGHPLAIELAAGRLGVVSLRELAELVGRCSGIVTASSVDCSTGAAIFSPDPPPLKAAFVKGWERMTCAERSLLEDLSTFSKAFSLEDLLAITGPPRSYQLPSLFDTLHCLVASGVVTCTDVSGETRYRLPVWLRSLVRELGDPERLSAAAARWAGHYAALAEANSPPSRTLNVVLIASLWEPLIRLSSLDSIDSLNPLYEEAASAALALDELFFNSGDIDARRALMERVSRWSGEAREFLRESTRARLALMEGRWLFRLCEFEEAKVHLKAAIELGSSSHRWVVARAAISLGEISMLQGNEDDTNYWLSVSRESLRVEPDLETESILEATLGSRALKRWELDLAEFHLRRSLECRRSCDSIYTSYAYSLLANALRYAGKSDQAQAAADRALATSASQSYGVAQRARAWLTLGVLRAQEGSLEQASIVLRRAADELRGVRLVIWYREALVEAAAIAEVTGNVVVARNLWVECAEVLEGVKGTSVPDGLAAARLAAGFAVLGDTAGARRWMEKSKKYLPADSGLDVSLVYRLHQCRLELSLAVQSGWSPPLREVIATAESILAEATKCSTSPPGLWHGRTRLRAEADAARATANGFACPIRPLASGTVVLPGGATLDLARRPVAFRVVSALADHFMETAGAPIPASKLAARVWPQHASTPDARLARLYVAIRELRKLGLSEVITSTPDGYSLRTHGPLASTESP